MKQIFLYFSLFRSYSFLSLSIPLFYFPCLLLSVFLLCLSLHIFYFLFLLLSPFASVVYFLSCCLVSFSSDIFCVSSTFSFCFFLFLCFLLSSLVFFYFLSFPVFHYIPLTLLFIFSRICVLLLLLSSYFFPAFSTFQSFVWLFCLFS